MSVMMVPDGYAPVNEVLRAHEDPVKVVGLGVDADEEAEGIVAGRLFVWKRLVAVVLLTVEGIQAIGYCASRPGRELNMEYLRTKARQNAREMVPILRHKLNLDEKVTP